MRKILLMGNPNVGKSVIFSHLTGVNVIASNYPGTTIEFTKGYLKVDDEKFEVFDIPGIYTLQPTSKAEEVAVKMLNEGDIIVNILDSTNLERNLNLTLQLIKKNIPILIVLNFWDETKHVGILIDDRKLEEIFGIPVIPTCAITGEGIKTLHSRIKEARVSPYQYEEGEKWHEIGKIVEQVQRTFHRHHTFLEHLGDASIKPIPGLLIAIMIMYLSFQIIRFIGEGLTGYVFEPLFENIWLPIMMKLSFLLDERGFIHNILIGDLIDGKIDFGLSFGILTTGLFVPIGVVLPYVFSFYLVLSFLEDSGYLPRLGVLLDNFMHRLGIHGLAIIPMLLGLGCNVPGTLATRVLEIEKERFIAITLIAICVPCMAQIAMIIGLVGKFGPQSLGLVFGTLFIVWIILGILQNLLLKGESVEIFVEIPPYRIPYFVAIIKKNYLRIKWFIKEALPFVLLGVFIVNILYATGIIKIFSGIAKPLTDMWGLPSETASALIVGFLRKDVAIGMLAPLGLTMKEAVISAVILTMYFPCVATFALMVKELGIKNMVKATGIMLLSTFIVGCILNLLIP